MALRDKEAHRAYCRAYYYAHDGKNRKRRPRGPKLTPEERRERKRLRSIEYRKRNKEKIRAYKARPDVRERHNAYNRMWRERNYEKYREYMREYMQGRRKPRVMLTEEQIRERHERAKAYKRNWYRANIAYYQIASFAYRQRMIERMKIDADFYANHRKKQRDGYRRRREQLGLPYTPKLSIRIPDWCVRGGELDIHSQWLWENVTDEQRAYARELAIERKKQRERTA